VGAEEDGRAAPAGDPVDGLEHLSLPGRVEAKRGCVVAQVLLARLAVGVSAALRSTPIRLRMSPGLEDGMPAIVKVPLVGGRIVVSTRMAVVLPGPFRPSTPRISPASTANESSSTATTPPYRRPTPRTSTAPVVFMTAQR
jgi:hypothetical protein